MRRYVRQDDPKFEMLHKGVLSGSTVVGATGLCEDSTSKFIPNWPAFMVRSARLMLARISSNAARSSLWMPCFTVALWHHVLCQYSQSL